MSFKDGIERIRHIAETLDNDDPDKLEMLEVEGDYPALMEWLIKKRTELLVMADANKELATIYKVRQTRFDDKAESLKELAGYIMTCAKETSYKGVSGTVSKKTLPPKPIVTNENKVPDLYKKKVIDKTAINQAIKEGEHIDGVSMDNGGEIITIRVK